MPKAALTFGQGAKRATITFDYIPLQPQSGATLRDHCDRIRDAWLGNVSVSQSSDCVLLSVGSSNPGGDRALVNVVGPGQANAAALPINCAVLVRKQTVLGNRGRFYVPGILESQVNSDGAVIGVALAAWQTSMTNYWLALTNVGINMTVILTAVGGEGVAPVTGLQVDSTIATQRRRLRK